MRLLALFKKFKLLSLIFLLALFLRTYNLSDIPVGLHGDEASIGYNAYSMLKTARDQNGHFLPIAIDQFGDYRPAGYHYLDVPFVAVFGLNEFSVRLPSAIFGALSVIALYFLLFELFENYSVSIIGALMLAILPWDINISRATSEGIIATFFVLVGTLFYIKSLKQKHSFNKLLFYSALLFVLSFFFYHAHRYFVFMFFPILLVLSYLSYSPGRERVSRSVLLYIVLIVSLLLFLFIGRGTGRVSEVSLLSIPGGTQHLKQAMDEEGTLNPLITRFYDNKLFYYGRFFTTFYSEHLSGDFLFVNTGFPARYKVPFTGNLYLIQAPFLLIGLAFLLYEGIKLKKYHYLIPVFWLFIAPIPAGLTWEDIPNVQRASLMIPALVAITAFGFYESLKLFDQSKIKTIILVVTGVILLQNFLYFQHNYFWRLKVHEPWNRSAGEKDLIFTISNLAKDHKKIVMTTQNNNNFIFYLFYLKFDPARFQKLGSPREKDGLQFENITYTYNPCPSGGEIGKGDKTLYVNKQDCTLPKNSEIVGTIRTPDGIPSFQIVSFAKSSTSQ